MSDGAAWKSRPVFITSTFLDMQGERDFLRNVVFPELEERLRAQRSHLEWIDLRVGVANASAATEEARELAVLKVCLAEVKRSRPFLIALIGDRYGWVPPEARIKAAAAEEGFKGDVAGRSITDLEIDFGVLSDPEQRKRSYFYFREPLPYAEMGEKAASYSEEFDIADPAAEERTEKLEALKQRIRDQFPNQVRSYKAQWSGQKVTGFEKLRELVTEDLCGELEAETAEALAAGEVSWQQVERDAVADFAEDRARDFVGRDDILDRVENLLVSPAPEGVRWGLCITGEAGSGKSALFGEIEHAFSWNEHRKDERITEEQKARYRRLQATDALVLGHAAGASPRASSIDAMLRRWIDELAANLGVPSELSDDANDEDVEAAFASLLGRVAQRRRVIILVDALDQFEQTTQARNMTWLPRLWPDNARLIATAIPGEASQKLLQRPGVVEVPLPPLAVAEARDIVAAICRRYRRTFEPEVIDALVAKPGGSGAACGNPLWLTMTVEELNLLDADDFARARRGDYGRLPPAKAMCALMCDMVEKEIPTDIPILYAWSFDRAATVFGAPLTQAFLGVIAVSRGGWRESDFRKILPNLSSESWDELRFAQLRRSFRGQMRQRGLLGQWDFAHGQMRPAAKAWLERRTAPPEPAINAAIADHLLALPADDPLHIGETMTHLMSERDAPVRARVYYGSASLTDAETDGATRVLADMVLTAVDRTAMVERVLCLLEGNDIRNSGSAAQTANIAERLLTDFSQIVDQRVSLPVKATLFDRIKVCLENLLVTEPNNAGWQSNLAVTLRNIGHVLIEAGKLLEALQSFRDSQDIMQALTDAEPNDASRKRGLAAGYTSIGEVQVAQGTLHDGLQSFHSALDIVKRLWEAEPDNPRLEAGLFLSFQKIAEVLVTLGNLQLALETYQLSREAAARLLEQAPGNVIFRQMFAQSSAGMGQVLRAQQKLPDALKFYREENAVIRHLAEVDPDSIDLQHDLAASHINIARIFEAQGYLQDALKSLGVAHAVFQRLADTDRSNAKLQQRLAVSYIDLGGVLLRYRELADMVGGPGIIGDRLLAHADLALALKHFNDALAIMERLAKADPSNMRWQNDLSVLHSKIGGVLQAQLRLPEAMLAYLQSKAIFDRLAKSDPDNIDWQHNLARAFYSIAQLLLEQGNQSEAEENFAAWRSIHDELPASDANRGDVVEVADEQIFAALSHDKGADGIVTGYQISLLHFHHRYGWDEFEGGRLQQALESFRKELKIADRLAQADPDNAILKHRISKCLGMIGGVDAAESNLSVTLQGLRQELEILMFETIRSTLSRIGPASAEALFSHLTRIGLVEGPEKRVVDELGGVVAITSDGWLGKSADAATARTEAEAALDRGDAKSAREALTSNGGLDPTSRNLLAVCHLRLSEAQQALDILRPMIFPDGGFLPKESAEPAWIVNFATAMILRGDLNAGRSALRWLKDPNHPEAVRLLGAVEAWKKSLGAGGRFKQAFGGGKSISLNFPPGVY